jgi:zinc protease
MTTIRPKAKAPAGQAPGVEKPLIAPVPAAKVRPQIIERILPNGVRLLLCPVEGYPTVSIQMFTRGGLSVESEPCAGISSFMAEMMLKGTAKRKAPEIASALDAMGADMAAAAGRNTVYLSAKCLAEDYEKTFDLAADCFLHPTFPQDEMERMRTQILAGLAHMADTPQGEAGLYFNRVFFKDSPYQFPVLGTPDSVKAMTRQNLDAWHKKYVVGNNLVVAVFGGIDLRKAAYYAANAVETVPANTGLVFPKDVPPRTVPAREVYLKPSEKEAALVFVAYPGMDIYNVRDRFAMDILNTIMAGYQMPSGWLFEELRGKGLVYDVHAFSMVGLRPGYYAAEGECRPDKVAEVVRIIEADMARATKEEFTEKQLASARETVITAKELGRETLDGWAFEAAADECLGLGYNFAAEEIWRLRQVRPEDVIRVAREYLKTPVICVLTSDPKAAEAIKKQP